MADLSTLPKPGDRGDWATPLIAGLGAVNGDVQASFVALTARIEDDKPGGLQALLDDAHAKGVTLRIPPRNAFGNQAWMLDAPLVPKQCQVIELSPQTRLSPTTFPQPVFHLPAFGSDYVTITGGRLERPGPRKDKAAYDALTGTYYGVNSRAANSAILCFAEGVKIDTHAGENWRSGIRVANTGRQGLRSTNTLSLTHDAIDFPISGFGQRGLLVRDVRGPYSALANTEDPAHQVYLTEAPDGSRSIGTHIMSATTWDGIGGCSWSIKGQEQITFGHMTSDHCPGGLQIHNIVGSLVGDILHVTNIVAGEGGMIEGLRSGGRTANPALIARKMWGQIRVTHAPGIPAKDLRAVSLDDDWMIASIEHEYTATDGSDAQSSVHVAGNRSDLTAVRTTNLGPGDGVRGLNYADGTTGHLLRTTPNIKGSTTGLRVGDGVTNSTFYFDPTTVRPSKATYARIQYPKTGGVVIRTPGGTGRPWRRNRWHGIPLGASLADVVLSNGIGYPTEIGNADPITISKSGVPIRAAAAAGVKVRICYYADYGNGDPGRLIFDAGTVPATAIGVPTVDHATITLPPYAFMVQIPEGGNVTVRGMVGPAGRAGASTPEIAASAASVAMSGIPTGTAPASFEVNAFPTAGYPRGVMFLPSEADVNPNPTPEPDAS